MWTFDGAHFTFPLMDGTRQRFLHRQNTVWAFVNFEFVSISHFAPSPSVWLTNPCSYTIFTGSLLDLILLSANLTIRGAVRPPLIQKQLMFVVVGLELSAKDSLTLDLRSFHWRMVQHLRRVPVCRFCLVWEKQHCSSSQATTCFPFWNLVVRRSNRVFNLGPSPSSDFWLRWKGGW